MFDPYSGITAGSLIPDYYNPYKNLSGASGYAGPQNQPGQQAGQRLVPGKDAPTPGSKHGRGGPRVRIAHPHTGEVREVDAAVAQRLIAKGGRVV
jgi:hypothetical protein